jgi:hypothetical protein
MNHWKWNWSSFTPIRRRYGNMHAHVTIFMLEESYHGSCHIATVLPYRHMLNASQWRDDRTRVANWLKCIASMKIEPYNRKWVSNNLIRSQTSKRADSDSDSEFLFPCTKRRHYLERQAHIPANKNTGGIVRDDKWGYFNARLNQNPECAFAQSERRVDDSRFRSLSGHVAVTSLVWRIAGLVLIMADNIAA